jgi:enterochelin esterase family protein
LNRTVEEHTMNRILRVLPATALATLVGASVQAQIANSPPGGSGPGRGRGVEASVVTNVRSPEVNADHTITFRLPAPNARKVRVYTDMPKLGDTPVNGSAGFDMTQDAQGVWSFTTPKLAPSYYQYWFEVDGLTTPDPQNTFVRPASGVYKSVVALPGKEADFMMFRDVPHGNLIEHQYVNQLTKVARRVVVYTPPDYNTGNKKYPVVYLLHGANDYERGWTQTGMANTIMDNLIAEGKAVPAIIVMPFGHDTTGASGKLPEVRALQTSLGYTPPPGRGRRGFGRGGAGPAGPSYMEKDLLGYVMPYVEKEFRVIKDKKARAIMGYSMGGGHSTTIGFGHPELFSVVGGFSGYNRSAAEPLLADPAKANENYKIIFIGSGTEDGAVNGGRALHAAFTDKGVNHIWSEDPGYGHDYQIWRIYLHTLLQKTFRD